MSLVTEASALHSVGVVFPAQMASSCPSVLFTHHVHCSALLMCLIRNLLSEEERPPPKKKKWSSIVVCLSLDDFNKISLLLLLFL